MKTGTAMEAAIKWLALGAGCVLMGLAVGCDSDSDEETSVSVSPSSVFLSADKVSVVTFIASGGDSNYVWSLSSTNLGELFVADENAIYKSTTNAGVNTLQVADGDGELASAVITQE